MNDQASMLPLFPSCKRGHIKSPDNLTNSGKCRQCQKDLHKEYQAKWAAMPTEFHESNKLSPTFLKNFRTKILMGGANDCWEWQAGTDDYGYGHIRYKGKIYGAHRLAYEYANGPIAENMYVLHSCDNPPCCNPAHLRQGTPLENMQDKIRRGRHNSPSGENQKDAKMTWVTVAEARQLHQNGTNIFQLSKMFGVRNRTMEKVIKRITWKEPV